MPTLERDALQLIGFTLAHAAWGICESSADELLCPLALIETAGQRQLLRFEADSQAEAVEMGKAKVAAAAATADRWSLAREGVWRPSGSGGSPQDVLTVEGWARGMATPVVVLQPFERADSPAPTASGRFRMLGPPALVIDGQLAPQAVAEAAREDILAGVQNHGAVAPLWPTWQ